MDRIKSNHQVTVLDFSGTVISNIEAYLLDHGHTMKNYSVCPFWVYGIVEKSGKHFLINTEGVGSFIALENKPDEISFYKKRYNDAGQCVGFEISPCINLFADYDALVENGVVTDKNIPLDEFIRNHNYRLENNFRTWEDFLNN